MDKLEKLLTYCSFMRTIADVEVDSLPENERECSICREPYGYDIGPWKPGAVTDYPVALPCGRHHVGFQCLARWMSSDMFDNRCSFCRQEIVTQSWRGPPAGNSDKQVNTLLALLAIFDTCATPTMKENALKILHETETNREDTVEGRRARDRNLILYEQILDSIIARKHAHVDNPWRIGIVGPVRAEDVQVRNDNVTAIWTLTPAKLMLYITLISLLSVSVAFAAVHQSGHLIVDQMVMRAPLLDIAAGAYILAIAVLDFLHPELWGVTGLSLILVGFPRRGRDAPFGFVIQGLLLVLLGWILFKERICWFLKTSINWLRRW